MRVYTDIENVKTAADQGKPERVIKKLWVSYAQGEAYRKYMDEAEEEYAQTYGTVEKRIVYTEEKEAESSVDAERGEAVTRMVPVVPDEYLDESGELKEAFKDYAPVPSLELYLKKKDEAYRDIEPTDGEFEAFWAPYAKVRAKKRKEEVLAKLKVEANTVLYDANGRAIGNMASVVGIANWKFNQAMANGAVADEAYKAIYKDTTVRWRGADNEVHEVQVESICEALQNSMLEVAKVIGVV